MNRLLSFARGHSLDWVIGFAAAATTLDLIFRRDAPQAPRTTPWITVPAVVFVILVLLGRRRWPFAAPASVWMLGAAVTFVDGRVLVFTAGAPAAALVASFLLGELKDVARARAGLAITLIGATTVAVNNPDHSQSDLLFVPVPFVLAWLAGVGLRERGARADAAEEVARRAEAEREATARVAVAEERARIARELHDIVAHAVSVMVLQVGAVRHHLPDELSQDKEALTGVERTGRTALNEMRRLLGAMRRGGDDLELSPQPGLETLDLLLDEVRRAGLPVRLHVDGNPIALPRTLDLSAYRIVQEGLTNALKHAHASHADVVVRYRLDQLQVDVRDDGRASAPRDGSGHGLVGIGERVKIYGGEMTAGAAPEGGFLLSARIPLDGDSR